MNYDYNVELYSWEAIRNKLLNQVLYINRMLPLIASTLLSIPSTNTPSEKNSVVLIKDHQYLLRKFMILVHYF